MKVLGASKNFLAIEKKFSSYEKSKIVILSAPYEKTVSYGKGTVNGPKKILEASHYVEFFDEEFIRELCIDKGITSLPELKIKDLPPAKALKVIEKAVEEQIRHDKFVVTLGGEHSISLGPIRAHFNNYKDLSILQFDAHSDLRDSYEGSKYSHASVMARVAEFTKDITQVGIRAQCKEENDFIKKNKIKTFYARDIKTGKHGREWNKKVLKGLSKNVYITFDVDGFDPSVISATGTPEPGGMLWDETIDLLKLVGKERNIVGFDVVELAPEKNNVSSDFNTAKLVYKMLNCAFANE